MKNKTAGLSDEIKKEIDFAYVEELGEQERRAVTFYEYARHSNPLKELVAELRQEGAFSKERVGPLSQKLLLKLNSKPEVLRQEQLLGLVVSDGFPEKPYSETKLGRGLFTSNSNYYGIEGMSRIPWPAIVEGWFKHRNIENALADVREWSGTSTLHAIAIPWKYSNDQLAKMFLDLLRDLRPDDLREPKKVGRTGGCEKVGVVDMLHQLAAHRLQEAGHDFFSGGHLYISEKGWKKAIGMAKKRIQGMMVRPFFGSSAEEDSGTK